MYNVVGATLNTFCIKRLFCKYFVHQVTKNTWLMVTNCGHHKRSACQWTFVFIIFIPLFSPRSKLITNVSVIRNWLILDDIKIRYFGCTVNDWFGFRWQWTCWLWLLCNKSINTSWFLNLSTSLTSALASPDFRKIWFELECRA